MILPLALTVADVQGVMNIAMGTAYELIPREDFPSLRIGRAVHIPKDAFLRWLNQQCW